jgi:hypothetical protein
MSWGALGNALIGGHQAFRQAVAEREDLARREELDRRYQAEQQYRASRDTVEDQRYQDTLARQQDQDAQAKDERLYDRTSNQLRWASEFDAPVDPMLKANAGTVGLGGLISTEAPLTGFAADANSIAGGSIAADRGADYVRRSPGQVAQERTQANQARATELEIAEATRQREEQATFAKLMKDPTIDWGNPSRAMSQILPHLRSPEALYKFWQTKDDLATGAAQRGFIGDQGQYYRTGGSRREADPPRTTLGGRYTADPAAAAYLDSAISPKLLDDLLEAELGRPQVAGTPPMTPERALARRADIEKAAVLQAVARLQAQGRPIPADLLPLLQAAPATGTGKGRFADFFAKQPGAQHNNY